MNALVGETAHVLREVGELGGWVRIDGRGYWPRVWRNLPSLVAARGPRLGWWDALILLYAVLAAFCRPLTASAAVVVLLSGVALLVLAARQRRAPGRVVCSWRSVLPWVVLVLLFGGWELTAALWGNDSAHPTLSLLLNPVLETYPGRLFGWFAWLGVGRWLVTAQLVILVGFVGLLGAVLTVEMLGRAGRGPFQPVARVLEAALASRIGLWVVWGAWLWIGFHFLAR